jgi:Ca2+-transporting ATPase
MAETTENQPKWYTLSAEAVAKELQVDPAKGLSAAEVQQRQQKFGRNELVGKQKESSWLPWQK